MFRVNIKNFRHNVCSTSILQQRRIEKSKRKRDLVERCHLESRLYEIDALREGLSENNNHFALYCFSTAPVLFTTKVIGDDGE